MEESRNMGEWNKAETEIQGDPKVMFKIRPRLRKFNSRLDN